MTRQEIKQKYGNLPPALVELLIELGVEVAEEVIQAIIKAFHKAKEKRKAKMVTMQELLSNQCAFDECSPEIQKELGILLNKINQVRVAYGKPMIVTSGLRTMKHHLEIYAAKGIIDKSKIPMKSNHLFGKAVDIADADKSLKHWCMVNTHLLEQIGLWMEDFDYTPTWVHFQTVPPKSGKRFFKP